MAAPRFTPEPPIYTFRIRILDCMAGYAPENATEIQREIEIAANHTLGDLGYAILDAYKFDSDHFFSFFLSGKPWDRESEYALHDGGDGDLADLLGMFPEGSEMQKLALLSAEADLDPDAPLPAEINQERLRGEIAGLFRDMAADAPAADRPMIEEFAQLIATTETIDPAMMSDALRQYVASVEPDDEPAPRPLLSLPGIDLDGFDPFADDEEDAPDVDDILIRDVPYPGKTGKKEFLFIFDYGDEWRFGVKLLGIAEKKTPRARYPRVTARRGKAPEQYPAWDDHEEWEGTEWVGIGGMSLLMPPSSLSPEEREAAMEAFRNLFPNAGRG